MKNDNLANLFIVGASKCGTTFLHDILGQHPDIYMSKPKELFHFTSENSSENDNKYNAFFSNGKNNKYRGESTPAYLETTSFNEIPKKICKYNAHSKIIIILRSPFERLESVYAQTLSTGHTDHEKYYVGKIMSSEFKDAVINYPPFLEATKYWTHFSNYRKYFADENIKLVLFEDLINDNNKALRDICSFLDIDQNYNFNYSTARKNKRSTKKVFSKWPSRVVNLTPKIIKKMMPKNIQSFALEIFKKIFLKKIPVDFWDDELRDKIHNILLPEVNKIYEYLNIDDDPWRFKKK